MGNNYCANAYGRVARGYLAFLEQRGITGLDAARPSALLLPVRG